MGQALSTVGVSTSELKLRAKISEFYDDPLGYVLFAFPWGVKGTPLENEIGPEYWQREVLEEVGRQIRESPDDYTIRIGVGSGHGSGKLGTMNSKIPTPTGYRRFGDLKPGDRVFGSDGKAQRVTHVIPQGVHQLYRVTFDDGSYMDTSKEHEWNVKGRQQRRWGPDSPKSVWITMETQEILEKGVLRKNGIAEAKQWEIPIQGAVEFEPQPLPMDPYTIGAWIGDGTEGRICNPDEEIIQKIAAGHDIVTLHDQKRTQDGRSLDHSIRGILPALKDLGLRGKRSWEKFIPDVVKFNSVEVRHQCLIGLMDTDGTANKNGCCSYTTVSKQLAEDFVWLARSLGAKAKIQPTVKNPFYRNDQGEKVYCKPAYNCTITAPLSLQLFSVKHKAERRREPQARYLSRWIESIEPIGEEEGMCITVENEDGLYLADDFIVTHNSACTSWAILWAMSTRPDLASKITANTQTQLKTRTWRELAIWHKMAINSHWFQWNATSFNAIEKPNTWFVAAEPNTEHNSEAFAGLHGEHVLIIIDEASAVPDKIFEVLEGALTEQRAIMLVFGNITRPYGQFFEIFGRLKHRWKTWQVDIRKCRRTNKRQIEEWIEDYGIDSDFVRVRVRGLAPHAAPDQFIPSNIVTEAMEREIEVHRRGGLARVMGVDIARKGGDQSVISIVDGRKLHKQSVSRNHDTMWTAAWIAKHIDETNPDSVRIDAGSFGIAVIDRLRQMGYVDIIEVNFGGEVNDPSLKDKLLNLRILMWWRMRIWLKTADIPADDELFTHLTTQEYDYSETNEKQKLESKKKMREKGLASPDKADSLAVVFSLPFPAITQAERRGNYQEAALPDY